MKGLRIGFIVLAAAVFTFGLSGMAFAFHSGGVAECMGCHNIHDGKSPSGLLQASDASSTCTNDCHGAESAGSYHIASLDAGPGVTPRQMTPGGDFGWLLKSYTWVPRSGTTESEDGERHGHNVVMADRPGFIADSVNGTAPGGDMDSSYFSCTDCHDQHGKLRRLADGTYDTTGAPIFSSGSYHNSPEPAVGRAVGVYRLLRGPGSGAGPGGVEFNDVFNAIAPSSYNKSEGTAQVKVAYGSGVTGWCAACHPEMHSGNSLKLTHPTNQGFSAAVVAIYNSYVGSGVTGTSGFDSLVPFQMAPGTTYADMKTFATGSVATLAATSNRVNCLSCHRSHASGWQYMTRWNATGNEFIAVDGVWPGTDSPSTIASAAKYAQGRTVAETEVAYNGKAMGYATYQRSLCNKCHAKD